MAAASCTQLGATCATSWRPRASVCTTRAGWRADRPRPFGFLLTEPLAPGPARVRAAGPGRRRRERLPADRQENEVDVVEVAAVAAPPIQVAHAGDCLVPREQGRLAPLGRRKAAHGHGD